MSPICGLCTSRVYPGTNTHCIGGLEGVVVWYLNIVINTIKNSCVTKFAVDGFCTTYTDTVSTIGGRIFYLVCRSVPRTFIHFPMANRPGCPGVEFGNFGGGKGAVVDAGFVYTSIEVRPIVGGM
jgi:hypothetical protein